MQKNIYSTNISGLFNPEIFFNYASNTTCFNPDKIYDSPFAQIPHGDHWVTVTNCNSFYEEQQQQHENKWFYFDSFNKPLVYIPYIKNAMKRLNSKASSIKIVH
jgi:hypothetical protein